MGGRGVELRTLILTPFFFFKDPPREAFFFCDSHLSLAIGKGPLENVCFGSWRPQLPGCAGLGRSPGGESGTLSLGGCGKRSRRTSQGPSWLIGPAFLRHFLCGNVRCFHVIPPYSSCSCLWEKERMFEFASLRVFSVSGFPPQLVGHRSRTRWEGDCGLSCWAGGDGTCRITEGFLKAPLTLPPEIDSVQGKGLKHTGPDRVTL